jgi:hypothetical protein
MSKHLCELYKTQSGTSQVGVVLKLYDRANTTIVE